MDQQTALNRLHKHWPCNDQPPFAIRRRPSLSGVQRGRVDPQVGRGLGFLVSGFALNGFEKQRKIMPTGLCVVVCCVLLVGCFGGSVCRSFGLLLLCLFYVIRWNLLSWLWDLVGLILWHGSLCHVDFSSERASPPWSQLRTLQAFQSPNRRTEHIAAAQLS